MMVEVAIRERTVPGGSTPIHSVFIQNYALIGRPYCEARGFYSKDCPKMGFLLLLRSLEGLGFSL